MLLPYQSLVSNLAFYNKGVLKIHDIPYNITPHDVHDFLDRYMAPLSQPAGSVPVHIVMERSTGKIMDCFVEFPTVFEAEQCLKAFQQEAKLSATGELDTNAKQTRRGRPKPRMGLRHVHVDMSSQAELMKATFPRARFVEFEKWSGAPSILERDVQDPFEWTFGFRGYVTSEEVFGLIKFAEHPTRVSPGPLVDVRC